MRTLPHRRDRDLLGAVQVHSLSIQSHGLLLMKTTRDILSQPNTVMSLGCRALKCPHGLGFQKVR